MENFRKMHKAKNLTLIKIYMTYTVIYLTAYRFHPELLEFCLQF